MFIVLILTPSRRDQIEAAGGDRAYYITMEDAKNVLKASDYEDN